METRRRALSGSDPFIMEADGKCMLFVPSGLKDGPLPTHYEPIESARLNSVLAVVLGCQFPLTDVPWQDLERARGWLADLVAQSEPGAQDEVRRLGHWRTLQRCLSCGRGEGSSRGLAVVGTAEKQSPAVGAAGLETSALDWGVGGSSAVRSR